MARRQRIATGRTLPAGLVSLYEELYPTRSGSWQIRWTLEGIGTATRTKPTKSAARQFQSELRRAIAAGEPFDTGTREPAVWSEPVIDQVPTSQPVSLLDVARQHVARRWPELKPTSRGSMIETYALAVWAHLPEPRPPRADAMAWGRRALVPGPQAAERLLALPFEAQQAGGLIEQGSLPVADLAQREVIERLVEVLKCRADGTAYAPNVVTRNRRLLNQLLAAAVRAEHLDSNPLELTQPPRRRNALRPVGEREVISVPAGIALLELCAADTRTDRLTAYFACGFWAGMRPAEIEGMNWTDLHLPAQGWGRAVLSTNRAPVLSYTNDGEADWRGSLKWREEGETRPVPLHPQLVGLLLRHRERYAAPVRGRLIGPVFHGPQGGKIDRGDLYETFRTLRDSVLADPASPHWVPTGHPLRRLTPYGLRHAAATMMLAAGVPAAEVAERLGHSIHVLQTVYAGFLRSHEARDNELIERYYEQEINGFGAAQSRAVSGPVIS